VRTQVPESTAYVVLELRVDWSGVDLRATNVSGPRLCFIHGTQKNLGDGSTVFWVSLQ
jgi:hypothetical protein